MRKAHAAKPRKRKWSQRVTKESSALALESGVFTREPRAIALSLKRSAEKSKRRKSDPYRSAMSMLTFYINRAGKQLSKSERARLERAKQELRKEFGRDDGSRQPAASEAKHAAGRSRTKRKRSP